MRIKTEFKGVYVTNGGTFYFNAQIKNKYTYFGNYSSAKNASADKQMYSWACSYLKRKNNYKHNIKLGILISTEHIELLYKYRFCLDAHGYPVANVNKEVKALHKLILNKKGFIVDHKNRNVLDCRDENLRYCSQSQNAQNAKIRSDNLTGVKGVQLLKNAKKRPWHARITFNKKIIIIGNFATKEDAVEARQEKARALFGEFYNG